MIRAVVLLACLGLAACASGSEQAGEAGSDSILVPAASIDDPGGADPGRLLHLADADVRQILGEPEFVWVEAGAAMLRYRGQGCFVDVFLYRDEGVTFVEIHGENLDDRARRACFRTLVRSTTS